MRRLTAAKSLLKFTWIPTTFLPFFAKNRDSHSVFSSRKSRSEKQKSCWLQQIGLLTAVQPTRLQVASNRFFARGTSIKCGGVQVSKSVASKTPSSALPPKWRGADMIFFNHFRESSFCSVSDFKYNQNLSCSFSAILLALYQNWTYTFNIWH